MTPENAPRSRWSDLDRPPLNEAALRHSLLQPGGLWTSFDIVPETGSTNSDLAARAGSLDEGAVLVAEVQTAGRGRLDRTWSAPPRSGLFVSVLLKPGADIPVERWGWLPLLAGVASAAGLSRAAGVDMYLKWPNDLLVKIDGEERKTGGILAERSGDDAVVIGIGLNVTLHAEELPVPEAGSSPSRTRSPPTVTRCCGPCCARWSSGTATGALRAATRACRGSRRRTRRAARRWDGAYGPSCPANAQ